MDLSGGHRWLAAVVTVGDITRHPQPEYPERYVMDLGLVGDDVLELSLSKQQVQALAGKAARALVEAEKEQRKLARKETHGTRRTSRRR